MEKEDDSLSGLMISKKLIQKNREFGFNYGDTQEFDDFNELCKKDENIGFYGHIKLKKVTVYYGLGWKKCKGVIVGIHCTYYNCLNGMIYLTGKRIGSDTIESEDTLKLENDEYIMKIELYHQTVVRGITIHTSIGKIFSKGVKEGTLYVEDFSDKMEHFVIGFFGGYGQHLHYLGIYYANKDLFLKHQTYQLTMEEVHENYEPFKIRATQRIGKFHNDSKLFDDHQEILKKKKKNLLQMKIHKINFWRGKGFKKLNGLLNGIQVFYTDLDTYEEHKMPASFGKDDLEKNQPVSYNIGENEYIETVKIKHHGLVDSITLMTNYRQIFIGGDGAEKIDNFYFTEDHNSVAIGFFGGYGGNVHNIGINIFLKIGCYFADIREINYWRRKFYIEIYYQIKKNESTRNKLENQMTSLGHKIWNVDRRLYIWGKILLLKDSKSVNKIISYL